MSSFSKTEKVYDKLMAIKEDHEYIKKNLPDAAILTLNYELVTLTIIKTAYARVQIRLQYNEDYPLKIPIIELTSPTLPLPLLRNKEKECHKLAESLIGKPQLQVMFESLYTFIHDNAFVPCWREVKKLKSIIEQPLSPSPSLNTSSSICKMRVNEKKGVIHLDIYHNQYRLSVDMTIPFMYPEDGLIIDILSSSNFPYEMQQIFKAQADDIVRRCIAGFNPEDALACTLNPDSNRLAIMKVSNSSNKDVKITSDAIKGLQHDVQVLKQISDLRDVNNSKNKNQPNMVYSTKERKIARKDLKRLAKLESRADIEEEEKLKEQEQEEMISLLNSKPSGSSKPSLLVTSQFLIEHCVEKLVKMNCQCCNESVMPSDVNSEILSNSKSVMRPIRTFCGHWLHWKCLNHLLTSPPFIRECVVCNRRIYHSDWSSDHKKLERAWQNKQARKREKNDVADFLDMSDFSV